MARFTWNESRKESDDDHMNWFLTRMVLQGGGSLCGCCGQYVEDGDAVLFWVFVGGPSSRLLMHERCVSKAAGKMIQDLAACLPKPDIMQDPTSGGAWQP